MKRTLTLLAFGGALCLFAVDQAQQPVYAFTNGAPGGYTGSIDDGRTCGTNGGCHGGGAIAQPGAITSTIPGTGYVPGQTYDVSVTVTAASSSKFGFEATAEDGTGTQVGTMIGTSATTVLSSGVGSGHITHKSSSTSGSGSKTWTFQWQAPSSNVGDVTFYMAGNASNSNGATSGDEIFSDALTVTADIGVSIAEVEASDMKLLAYPNPTTDGLSLEFGLAEAGPVQVELFDISGKKVADLYQNSLPAGLQVVRVSLDGIPKSTYFVRVVTKETIHTESVLLL